MKNLTINISDKSNSAEVIEYLDKRIPESIKETPGFPTMYDEITSCISDFISKAKKVTNAGTTIHIEKTANIENLNVNIILDAPEKIGLMRKIERVFRRK